jgi:hypothetical protein
LAARDLRTEIAEGLWHLWTPFFRYVRRQRCASALTSRSRLADTLLTAGPAPIAVARRIDQDSGVIPERPPSSWRSPTSLRPPSSTQMSRTQSSTWSSPLPTSGRLRWA